MILPTGGHSRLDNAWLNAFMAMLPVGEAIRLHLQCRGNLRQKGAGLGELITATGDRDARHTERAAKRLVTLGLAVCVAGRYYAPEFAPVAAPATPPAQTPAASPAKTPAQNTANSPANASNSHVESVAQDGENGDENPPERREGREVLPSLPLQVESGGGEGRQKQTAEGLPGTPESTGLPSSETPGTATLEAAPDRPTTPPPPVPAAPPAPEPDAAARQFFDRLAGYNFVSRYQNDLTRWHAEYSEAFLRLAYRLGPAVKAARVPGAGFVFLLNRSQSWPQELQRQYAADLKAAGQEGSPDAPPVVGEVRVMSDGRSGRVLDVDLDAQTLTLQTGADATESIDVPWTATTPSVRRSA
ncbi:hypothetical protein [Deinococcus gobiensis]|uniref:Uncharacterized protein n=1 Tax=Deinococcus gobiensis (strain DSM 21396 / JCM 16679 / CGMCC 1.7299 / I-0) TaxID=745776 RepID=H8GX82_DEIGI|nr:hypothetical protein [Deinococcus gobiensis]AFD25811.1 hypothetical protein DGo_CA1884 [Deinococcus gobiensis I-0]